MPRKNLTRPMPKSKKDSNNRSYQKIRSFLGDESSSSIEDATFHSADLEDNQTDYGLDFTSSNVAGRSHRISTMRDKEPIASTSLYGKRSGNTKNPKTRRKQLTPKRRDMLFLRSVKQLQLRTDCLIPKAPFGRVIREILNNESTYATRLTLSALQALQESAEMYLTCLFQDAYCCTLHRGRVTLNVKDIELTKYLRGRSDPGNR